MCSSDLEQAVELLSAKAASGKTKGRKPAAKAAAKPKAAPKAKAAAKKAPATTKTGRLRASAVRIIRSADS